MFKNYPLLRSLALYRHMPYRFLFTALLFLTANVGIALQQFSVGQAIDHLKQIQPHQFVQSSEITDPSNPWFWFIAIVLIATIRACIQYIGGLSSLIIGQDLLTILRQKIFQQVQELDIKWHWQHGLGEVLARTTRDSDKLKEALISFWRQVFESTLVVIVSVGLLCYYHPLLGLIPLTFVAFGLATLFYLTNKLVVLDHQVGLSYEKVSDSLSENIHGIRVIKAFALEDKQASQFQQFIQHFMQRSIDAIRFGAKYLPVPQIIIALLYVWVMGFGAYLISQGQLQIGEFVASLLMANMLVFRIESIGQVLHVFADARASAGRIWQMLDVKLEIEDGTQQISFDAKQGLSLKLEQVNLNNEQGKALLKDINAEFKPHQIVTIVGKTGSGKTTLLNVLNRFFDVSSGRVLIGAQQQGWHNVKDLPLAQLRQYVQMIPQENFFFSGTLAENLRVAKPDATEEDMHHALYLASASEILQRLEHGLDTKIGDKGVTLSGGQKQRIALARAILKDSPILALDDSTSALDASTERQVLQRLKTISKQQDGQYLPKTIIINSNKQTTIALSDWIIVLDHGEIVAQGQHDTLVVESEFYRQIMGFEHAQESSSTHMYKEA